MRENTGLERAVSGAHDYARTFGSSSIQPFVQFSISLASELYSSFAAKAKEDDGPIIDGTAVPADGNRP